MIRAYMPGVRFHVISGAVLNAHTIIINYAFAWHDTASITRETRGVNGRGPPDAGDRELARVSASSWQMCSRHDRCHPADGYCIT